MGLRLLRRAFLPLSLLVIVAAAFEVPLPFFVQLPGRLLPLAACVSVDDPEATPVEGDYLLTTIHFRGGTTVNLLGSLLEDDSDIVPRSSLLPPGVDTDAYWSEQRAVFDTTAEVAAAVGLGAAGLRTSFDGDGVLVVRALPGTPADGMLEPGDVITHVDGRQTPTDDDLRERIEANGSGVPLALTVTREQVQRELSLTPVTMQGRPILGIEVRTVDPQIDLPVPVDVESGRIGGPSAGLMIAVTVYDKVDAEVDLAAGRTVAGTGSVDRDGTVGPIGGIRQKVIAADRRDVDVFLAPEMQFKQARSGLAPGSTMRVLSVGSFDDAVAALQDSASRAASTAAQDAPAEACPLAS